MHLVCMNMEIYVYYLTPFFRSESNNITKQLIWANLVFIDTKFNTDLRHCRDFYLQLVQLIISSTFIARFQIFKSVKDPKCMEQYLLLPTHLPTWIESSKYSGTVAFFISSSTLLMFVTLPSLWYMMIINLGKTKVVTE